MTFKNTDGSTKIEYRNIDNNNLVELQRFKDNKPVGTWLFYSDKENKMIEMNYKEEDYENILKYSAIDSENKEFTPPVFLGNGKEEFRSFIAKQMSYPIKAAENKIQGEVLVQFVINETGKIEEFSIKKSVHPLLDKEAARLFSIPTDWMPAKLNGKAIKLQITHFHPKV